MVRTLSRGNRRTPQTWGVGSGQKPGAAVGGSDSTAERGAYCYSLRALSRSSCPSDCADQTGAIVLRMDHSAGVGVIGEFKAEIRAVSRPVFASHHLRGARAAAMRIRAVEDANQGAAFGPHFEPIMFDSTAVVIGAVAALDAFIGEIQFAPERSFPAQPLAFARTCMELVSRKPTLVRLSVLAQLAGKAPPDFGRYPGQAVRALIELRNELVHYEPEWTGEQTSHAKLGTMIKQYAVPSPFLPSTDPLFPYRWMSYGSAKWAVESVRDFALETATANGWICPYADHPEWFELPGTT